MENAMKDAARIRAIAQVNELALDQRLHALKLARTATTSTQAHIAALEMTDFDTGCSVMATAQVALLYEVWSEERRKQLNLLLARQKVIEMEADAAARIAFSKKIALQGLSARIGKRS
jgi:hypothetical protein